MDKRLVEKVNKFTKENGKKKRWQKVVSVLSAIVVFCTTYALILPAITMEKETYCGYESEHTEACYETKQTLVCGLEEGGHIHGDACYEGVDELICTLPESDGHTHGDECYTIERVLSCGKEETDGHAHTDACYKEESTLVCTNEDPEHVHGDGCYQVKKTLVCNQEERPAHHHDDSCYKNEKVLTCGKTQAAAHHHTSECYSSQKKLICKLPEGHRHTAECYKTERSLICGKEVHEHTLQCFSNPYADIEDSSVWDRSVASVELTGDWRKDLVAIAETQLGVEESKLNYSVEADGKTMNGYSRYGAWYGRPYDDWNAMFCSFCLHYAQIDSVVPIDNNCANWIAELKKAKFYNDKEDYVPQTGDLVFFDRDSDGTAERVGIVAQVTEKAIKTIEGNSADKVKYNKYPLNDFTIFGYGVLPENPGISEEPTEAENEKTETSLIEQKTVELPFAKVEETESKVTLPTTIEDAEAAENTEELPETEETAVEAQENAVDEASEEPEQNEEAEDEQVAEESEIQTLVTDELLNEELMTVDALTDAQPEEAEEVTYYCGIEEHIHNEECCDENGELICGMEAHEHDETCLIAPEAPTYYCGFEEHIHSEGCHDENGALICGLEEHTHDETCLIAPEEIVYYCGLEEHVHTDECYDENGELICGLEEHAHDETCLIAPEEVTYYCGLEEHVHSEECYDENGELICGLEEHTHDETCLIAPEDDLIEAGEDERIHPHAELVEFEALSAAAAYAPALEEELPQEEEIASEMEVPVDLLLDEVNETETEPETENEAPFGSVRLFAEVDEIDVEAYTWQWQIRYEGGEWENLEGATGLEAHIPYTPACDTAGFRLKGEKIETEEEMYFVKPMLFNAASNEAEQTENEDEKAALLGDLYITGSEEAEELISPPVGLFAAAAPITDNTSYWKKITSTNDLSGTIMIVKNGYALNCNTQNSGNSQGVSVELVPRGDSYYTFDSTSTAMRWTLGTGNSLSARDSGNTLRYLRLRYDNANSNNFFSTSSGDARALTFAYTAGTGWRASFSAGGTTYNLTANNNGAFLRSTTQDNTLQIYKLVDAPETEKTYWKKATTAADFVAGQEYLIVSKNGGYALNYNGTRTDGTGVGVTLTATAADATIYENANYVADSMTWIAGNNSYSFTNKTAATNSALQLGNNSNLFGTATQLTGAPGETWTFRNGNGNYLVENDGVFSRANASNNNNQMELYYKVDAPQPVGTTTYWKKATQLSDLKEGQNYLIVSNNGNYALKYNDAALDGTGVKVTMTQTDADFDTYQTDNVTSDKMLWTTSGNNVIANKDSTDIYLRLQNTALFGNSRSLGIAVNNGIWTINNGQTDAYYLIQNGGTFSRSNNPTNNQQQLTIYYQVDDPGSGGDDPDAEIKFVHRKYIDYLGDGVANPDTDLQGDDMYRLYLDMTGRLQPQDMLLIVDRSASMNNAISSSDSTLRDTALMNFLNGSGSTTGFIKEFLTINPENKLAIVWFGGNATSTNNPNFTSTYYGNDSGISTDWTSNSDLKVSDNGTNPVGGRSNTGTNYMAGMWRALEELDKVKDDGRPKTVVFLSDGRPTFYVTASNSQSTRTSYGNNLAAAGTYSQFINKTPTLYRFGDGTESQTNIDGIGLRTVDAANEFRSLMSNYGNVTMYSVAYASGSTDSLKALASKPGNALVVTSAAELTEKLTNILYPQGVRITDVLSANVVYYEKNDDLKIVKTPIDGAGETVVLYENGAITQAGTGILTEVKYTPSPVAGETTGTVTAKFADDYSMGSNERYTMSFNVTVSNTAKAEYRSTETYPNTGETNTDYSGNNSSSEQKGFYSNKSATTEYHVSGVSYTDGYEMPVVQIDDPADPDAPRPVLKEIDHYKRIDAFRDNIDNPDTDLDDYAPDLNDLYRLYLDIGPESAYDPIDVLFILDRSTSMSTVYSGEGQDATDIMGGYPVFRRTALNSLMNGMNPADKGKDVQASGRIHSDTMYDNGLLSSIHTLNPKNKIAVGTFAEASYVVYNWTDTLTVVGDNASISGTNYCAGLARARNMLSSVYGDGHRKILVFMSDGSPTRANSDPTDMGSGSNRNVASYTNAAITSFKNSIPAGEDLTVYSVGMGNFDTTYLDQISSDGTTISSLDFKKLLTLLDAKINRGVGHFTRMRVEDTLSEYVDFTEDTDLLVQKVPVDDETATTLYENGAITTEGLKYLQSVTLDRANKKFSVVFRDDYEEEGGFIYRASFNVQATQKAHTDHLKDPTYAGVKGDDDTDYESNTTSSLQPGYFSNSTAKVYYRQSLGDYTTPEQSYDFDRPVIQIEEPPEDPDDPEPDTEKSPDHYKRIDAFRDGEDNPDTDLDNTDGLDMTDLYRLYLDVGPESAYTDVDVLFVLDRSSSMSRVYNGKGRDATDILGATNVYRRSALNSLLNGLQTPNTNNYSTLYDNGLVSAIRNLNPENRVAVVSFALTGEDVYGWTKGGAVVGDNRSDTGTNYVAGLRQAKNMLDKSKGDGKKKLMIFMSDGEPTEYNKGMSDTGTPIDARGSTAEKANMDTWTRQAITEFKGLYPDLDIITVGIGQFDTTYLDLLTTRKSGTISSLDFKLLNKVIEGEITGGYGHYYDLRFTDKLSEYVDFYNDDLDFKIEQVTLSTGAKTLLYTPEGGKTTAGNQYIKSVTIDKDKKLVEVEFVDDYQEQGGFIFQTSFNVKATQAAYEAYAKSEYSGVTGDEDTDYGTNATSSEKPGFHSNDEAKVYYKQVLKDSVTDEQNEDFDHPVVQASADMVEVVKEWADDPEDGVNHDEDSVTIQLMQDGVAYGDTVTLNKACEWKHVFTQLPKNHVYTVEEQAVKGYVPEYSSQTIHPETGEDYLQLKVTNTPGSKIIKFRKSNEFDDPLSGAEFILCTDEACTTQVEGITLQTSDSSGYFTPEGGISLENGTYYLKETKAPDGYVPLNQLTKIVVSDTSVTMQTGINQPTEAPVDLEGAYVITVVNHSGYSLPVTGGSGTFLYYALGAMLMASALMFGCLSRCRRERRLKQHL